MKYFICFVFFSYTLVFSQESIDESSKYFKPYFFAGTNLSSLENGESIKVSYSYVHQEQNKFLLIRIGSENWLSFFGAKTDSILQLEKEFSSNGFRKHFSYVLLIDENKKFKDGVNYYDVIKVVRTMFIEKNDIRRKEIILAKADEIFNLPAIVIPNETVFDNYNQMNSNETFISAKSFFKNDDKVKSDLVSKTLTFQLKNKKNEIAEMTFSKNMGLVRYKESKGGKTIQYEITSQDMDDNIARYAYKFRSNEKELLKKVESLLLIVRTNSEFAFIEKDYFNDRIHSNNLKIKDTLLELALVHFDITKNNLCGKTWMQVWAYHAFKAEKGFDNISTIDQLIYNQQEISDLSSFFFIDKENFEKAACSLSNLNADYFRLSNYANFYYQSLLANWHLNLYNQIKPSLVDLFGIHLIDLRSKCNFEKIDNLNLQKNILTKDVFGKKYVEDLEDELNSLKSDYYFREISNRNIYKVDVTKALNNMILSAWELDTSSYESTLLYRYQNTILEFVTNFELNSESKLKLLTLSQKKADAIDFGKKLLNQNVNTKWVYYCLAKASCNFDKVTCGNAVKILESKYSNSLSLKEKEVILNIKNTYLKG